MKSSQTIANTADFSSSTGWVRMRERWSGALSTRLRFILMIIESQVLYHFDVDCWPCYISFWWLWKKNKFCVIQIIFSFMTNTLMHRFTSADQNLGIFSRTTSFSPSRFLSSCPSLVTSSSTLTRLVKDKGWSTYNSPMLSHYHTNRLILRTPKVRSTANEMCTSSVLSSLSSWLSPESSRWVLLHS